MNRQNKYDLAKNRTTSLASARRKIFCPGNTLIVCVRLANRRVDDAWCSGRIMGNMNLMLQDAPDACGRPGFVRRAHCLCNDGHALAAVRALEDLAGITPPRSAVLVRNLVQSLRCIQEHLLHFYQFHLSNWICLDTAPAKGVAQNLSGNGGCGHPDYPGSARFHLLVHTHSLESLQIQAHLNTALKLLGCKNGTYAAYQTGGISRDLDLGSHVLDTLYRLVESCRDFVCTTFLCDLEQVAQTYDHWQNLARANAFLCLGDFVRPHDQKKLFPGGVTLPAGNGCQDSLKIEPVQLDQVREEKNPEWERKDRMHYRLNFGRNGPLFYWTNAGFHWLSTPRHGEQACEVGSLARVMGAWATGVPEVCETINKSLEASGLLPGAMNSAVGRLLSRGIESSVLARASLSWLDELQRSQVAGDDRICSNIQWPGTGEGTGQVEVPRGALTHTIQMEKNKIVRHDYLIPSLWNFSGRDSNGRSGPLEQALWGTPVSDPGNPLEVLRIVHAFDPCNPCHVVVEDADTGQTTMIEAK